MNYFDLSSPPPRSPFNEIKLRSVSLTTEKYFHYTRSNWAIKLEALSMNDFTLSCRMRPGESRGRLKRFGKSASNNKNRLLMVYFSLQQITSAVALPAIWLRERRKWIVRCFCIRTFFLHFLDRLLLSSEFPAVRLAVWVWLPDSVNTLSMQTRFSPPAFSRKKVKRILSFVCKKRRRQRFLLFANFLNEK